VSDLQEYLRRLRGLRVSRQLTEFAKVAATLLIASMLAFATTRLDENMLKLIALASLIALGLLLLIFAILACRSGRRRDYGCNQIPPWYWRRPDPYIYDQEYLSGLGMEVTWDNPDIWFELGGTTVRGNLLANTTYEIVVAIHNASVEASAFNTLVEFYSRDYGAGAVPQFIGVVDVPIVPVQGFPPKLARITEKWLVKSYRFFLRYSVVFAKARREETAQDTRILPQGEYPFQRSTFVPKRGASPA